MSVNPKTTGYPAVLAPLAQQLQNEPVLFELSDQLQGSLGGADGQGSWRLLQNFFAEVAGRPGAVEDAVAKAQNAFAEAAT